MVPAVMATKITASGLMKSAQKGFQDHFNKKQRLEMMFTPGTTGVMKKMEDIFHTNMSQEERSKLQIKMLFNTEVQPAEDEQSHDKIKNYRNMQYVGSCKAVWRMNEHQICTLKPTVMILQTHMENKNYNNV